MFQKKGDGKTGRKNGGGFKRRRRTSFKYKVCHFCTHKIEDIDYKNISLLKNHTTERGKILGQRISGTCTKHQRYLSKAIKRARNLGLLPFAAAQ